MRAISIIFRRELGSYLRSPAGYIIAAIGLLINGVWFQSLALGGRAPKLSADVLAMFFFTSSLITMAMAILLAFRLIAEERQQNTIVLLNTSPVRDVEVVLGKFFAAFLFLGLVVLTTLYIPIQLHGAGKISIAQIAVGYLGLMLTGGAALAIGLFGSALTKNWLVALGISLTIGAILLVLGDLSAKLDPPLKAIFFQLDGWKAHFQPSFMRGVLNLKDVVYYLAVTYFFLLLATKTMEAKRWQ